MEAEPLARLFVDHSVKKLVLMQSYIEACLATVDESVVRQRAGASQNSIGNLILHLCGNVRQWIGSTIGGRPDVRDRDAEFRDAQGISADELLGLLRTTMGDAIEIVSTLDASRLGETVQTQDGPLSVLEVVYQVVGHFQQHTGQIVFAAKLASGKDLQLYRPRKA